MPCCEICAFVLCVLIYGIHYAILLGIWLQQYKCKKRRAFTISLPVGETTTEAMASYLWTGWTEGLEVQFTFFGALPRQLLRRGCFSPYSGTRRTRRDLKHRAVQTIFRHRPQSSKPAVIACKHCPCWNCCPWYRYDQAKGARSAGVKSPSIWS